MVNRLLLYSGEEVVLEIAIVGVDLTVAIDIAVVIIDHDLGPDLGIAIVDQRAGKLGTSFDVLCTSFDVLATSTTTNEH